jgi:beta-N-acetylhexosaminidase
MLAAILGCAGPKLTAEERAFFSEVQPWGFIVFQRNCESPNQLKALTGELREVSGRESVPILIDQEGGRVARLKPPHWRAYPPGDTFAKLAVRDLDQAQDAARLVMGLIAAELTAVGVNVDCLPILDVRQPDGHDVIGDRAYGADPTIVAAIGEAVALGLQQGGVQPIIKHIPGHGRARVDSHLELPVADVDFETLMSIDFAPFKALAHLPMAMTAHLLYPALDPEKPATTSKTIIDEVIRRHIGFDGLLMTDDLSMEALGGSMEDRARESLQAGCDVILHCNGKMEEMEAVARASPRLEGKAGVRAQAAENLIKERPGRGMDPAEAIGRLAGMGIKVDAG